MCAELAAHVLPNVVFAIALLVDLTEECLDENDTVKTTPQKTRCRSVNLYKEVAYRSKLSKWIRRQ